MDSNDSTVLSSMEIDAIGEILNISLGSSATSVSQMLGETVNITTPEVKLMKTKEFDIKLFEPAIGVEINYVDGLTGSNIMILRKEDVKAIVGLLLQTDFSDREFVMDEMNVGAICEVMNQMMGSAATALSQFLNRTINISPPNSFEIQGNEQFKEKYLKQCADVVAVYFDMTIGDTIKTKFINVMKTELAKELVANFGTTNSQQADADEAPAAATQPAPAAAASAPAPAPVSAPAPAPVSAPAPAPVSTPAAVAPQPQPVTQPMQSAAAQEQYYAAPPVPAQGHSVSNASYMNFDKIAKDANLTTGETSNLNMIMSVPLQITVEIGRTTKKIKEILDFSSGTIVELNRQAGSQVDVYVNGKAIAKGNVVVVDDNYGVRITEVMNSELMKLVN